MNYSFERDVIDRLARVETKLDSMDTRLTNLEGVNNSHRLNSITGGGVVAVMMAGVVAALKLLGWL